MVRFHRRQSDFETLENLTDAPNSSDYPMNLGDYLIWKAPDQSKTRLWKILKYIKKGENKFYYTRSIACLGDWSNTTTNIHTTHQEQEIPINEAVIYTGDECDMIAEIIDDFAWTDNIPVSQVSKFIFSHIIPFIKTCSDLKFNLNDEGNRYTLSTKCSREKGREFVITKQ